MKRRENGIQVSILLFSNRSGTDLPAQNILYLDGTEPKISILGALTDRASLHCTTRTHFWVMQTENRFRMLSHIKWKWISWVNSDGIQQNQDVPLTFYLRNPSTLRSMYMWCTPDQTQNADDRDRCLRSRLYFRQRATRQWLN